jgi:hypothetical protein
MPHVRERVSFAALGIANVGSGIYIASEPAYIGADVFVTTLAVLGVLLALPPLIAAVTGWTTPLADEGLFVNGIYWAFITALFALAHNDPWEWGLALILLGGTIASFSMWLGVRRMGVGDDG